MDLDGQAEIKKAIESNGKDNVIVVLGSPDANSAELYAETVTHGDPSWAGPLAGVPLGLPVYHVVEPMVKDAVDPGTYEEQVGVMDLALEKGPHHRRPGQGTQQGLIQTPLHNPQFRALGERSYTLSLDGRGLG